MRPTLLVTSTFLAVAATLSASACDNGEQRCNVDPDCPQGTICREGFCGDPSSTPGQADAAAIDSEPVDPPPGSSGTTSSGGSCADLYGLCATPFDCCAPLDCSNGTCR
ncbi:MAG: hypothetical protein KF819_08420 [Labilithrix sp.]|nr:hypothetical protein [Labilithrix sp.]